MSDAKDPQHLDHHATLDPRTGDQDETGMSDAKDPQHHDHHATLDPRYGDQAHGAPQAAGSAEPGSGHDDAQPVTTDADPSGEPTQDVPRATGSGTDEQDPHSADER